VLEASVEFDDPTGVYMDANDIGGIVKRTTSLCLIATDIPIKNIRPDSNYGYLGKNVVRAAHLAAKYAFDIESDKFRNLFRHVYQASVWRRQQGFKTILILEPPKASAVSSWERVFAQHGVLVSWIDQDGIASEARYTKLPDKLPKRKGASTSAERLTLINLGYGDCVTYTFNPAIGGKTDLYSSHDEITKWRRFCFKLRKAENLDMSWSVKEGKIPGTVVIRKLFPDEHKRREEDRKAGVQGWRYAANTTIYRKDNV
jgi:hypothetical protein